MWQFEHSVVVHASKQVVWQWWTDVEKWPQWDTDLIESAVLGEFAVGTQGRMKVADDALVSFVISEVIPEERFSIKIALFGATLSYTYAMTTEEDGSLKIVHGAHLSGLFGFIWRMLLKSKIQKTLTLALDEFARQVVAETTRIAALSPQLAPTTQAAEPGEVSADKAAPAQESKEVSVSAGTPQIGDPVENELREKGVRAQIEVAAQAPIVTAPASEGVEPPVSAEKVVEAATPQEVSDNAEHTAVVPVSPVITKKETKRPKKDS